MLKLKHILFPLATCTISISTWLSCQAVLAEDPSVFEDKLNADSIQWAAGSIPRQRPLNVKDFLRDSNVGRIVIDRYVVSVGGLDFTDLIFSGPNPGRMAIVTIWGSKVEGCFVEAFLQYDPLNGQVNLAAITPTLLELRVGSFLLQLPPQASTAERAYQREYQYYHASTKRIFNRNWYMTRNLFQVDAKVASVLANAPVQEIRAVLTLANGDKINMKLEEEIPKAWKQVYSFNPRCVSPETVKAKQDLAVKPLLNACKQYSDTPAQRDALSWLQTQISKQNLQEFSRRWRASLKPQAKPVELANACKFYKDTPTQIRSLEWLQTKLGQNVLEEFVNKFTQS